MDESQPVSPRARLQALLAIPERQRTDAQWDELNELEIMLAGGNREGAPERGGRGNSPPPGVIQDPAGAIQDPGGQHQNKKPEAVPPAVPQAQSALRTSSDPREEAQCATGARGEREGSMCAGRGPFPRYCQARLSTMLS